MQIVRLSIVVPLSLAIALLVVAGCGGSGTPPAPGAASSSGASEAAQERRATADAQADPARPADADREDDPAGVDAETLFEPSQAAGAVVGVPDPANTAPIVAVANYYTELPGYEFGDLTERQREKFLHRINSELCTCGCKNDTLARCFVNDPRCPLVRGMLDRVLEDIRSGK